MAGERQTGQALFPFDQAEGTHAERRNLLGLALMRVECDKHLAAFVEWVFNVTHGGLSGMLKKSYREIADRPWGLCCGLTKARTTVELAEDLGFVLVERNRYVSMGQTANGYAINWAGVREIVCPGRGTGTASGMEAESAVADTGPPVATRQPPVATRQPPVATRQPPVATRQPPVATRQPIKETTSLSISFNSVPDRRAGSEPTDAETIRREAGLTPPERDELRLRLLREHDLLRDAAGRRVAPARPGGLVGNAFAPLRGEHLRSTAAMTRWFRQQRGLSDPVTAGTEADLLLVLGLARHAMTCPAGEVRKSREAYFVSMVSRRRWRHACPHLAAVRASLDALAASHPEALEDVRCQNT